jgi:hypothetical protein
MKSEKNYIATVPQINSVSPTELGQNQDLSSRTNRKSRFYCYPKSPKKDNIIDIRLIKELTRGDPIYVSQLSNSEKKP